VEEKRQLALRQKKEADDKAKEEKAAKEATDKAARVDRADRGQAQEGEAVTSPTGEQRGGRRPSGKQNGNSWRGQPKEAKDGADASARDRASVSILQREGEGAGDMDTPDADANGTIIHDKETKPQEPVVVAGESQETTAEKLEDDGWSTVPAKSKNNRRGGGRAIAS
jgi:translation initiation factor 4B